MILTPCRILVILSAVAGLAHGTSRAADWPHWRGPQRNDVTTEHSGYRDGKWQIQEAWAGFAGIGCSSPLVIDGRIYSFGWDGSREQLTCHKASSGELLWQEGYPAPQYGRLSEGDKGLYSGPSSTPEYDPATQALYTLGVDGDVTRWRVADGRIEWRFNLYDRYGVGQRPDVGGLRGGASLRDYGYTTAPLIDNGVLIIEVGDTSTGTLKGFDPADGKELWTSDCKDEAGHSGGPVPITVEGIDCVVLLTMRSVELIRVDPGHAGKTLGHFDWTTDFANNIPTPAVVDNRILITTAYNQSSMICLKATKRKGLTKVWQNENPSGVCSPVVHNDHVYWGWQGIHCVSLATGAEVWTGAPTGTTGSCLVTGDNRLITWADQGDLILSETEPDSRGEYRELARIPNMFRADVWPHVVLGGGFLVVRDREGHMRCFTVQQ